MNNLLESSVDAYIVAPQKRTFVREEILQKIPGDLYIFSKESGQLYQPDEHEAFERISQKLRDRKKQRLIALKKEKGEILPARNHKKKSETGLKNCETGAKKSEIGALPRGMRKIGKLLILDFFCYLCSEILCHLFLILA